MLEVLVVRLNRVIADPQPAPGMLPEMKDDEGQGMAQQLADMAARHERGEEVAREELLEYQRFKVAALEAMSVTLSPDTDERITSTAERELALARTQLALLERATW